MSGNEDQQGTESPPRWARDDWNLRTGWLGNPFSDSMLWRFVASSIPPMFWTAVAFGGTAWLVINYPEIDLGALAFALVVLNILTPPNPYQFRGRVREVLRSDGVFDDDE